MQTTMAEMPELRQHIERAGQKTVFLEGPEKERDYVNPKGKVYVRLLAQLVVERIDRSFYKLVIFTLPTRDQRMKYVLDSNVALRAFVLASQARIGVYDCLYVVLAEREGCEFLTADD